MLILGLDLWYKDKSMPELDGLSASGMPVRLQAKRLPVSGGSAGAALIHCRPWQEGSAYCKVPFYRPGTQFGNGEGTAPIWGGPFGFYRRNDGKI